MQSQLISLSLWKNNLANGNAFLNEIMKMTKQKQPYTNYMHCNSFSTVYVCWREFFVLQKKTNIWVSLKKLLMMTKMSYQCIAHFSVTQHWRLPLCSNQSCICGMQRKLSCKKLILVVYIINIEVANTHSCKLVLIRRMITELSEPQ